MKNMGRGFGTASLVFGSICIPLGIGFTALRSVFSVGGIWSLPVEISTLLMVLGWLFPSFALIFGLVGMFTDDSKVRAIAGFILGLIGLILVTVIPIIFENIFASLTP